MRMAQFKQTCVYCMKPGVTKEHFWGKWTRNINALAQGGTSQHRLVRWDDPTDFMGPRQVQKGGLNRPGTPRSQTLKIACGRCNGGWMSRMVENAKPILERLSKGAWSNLTTDERSILSAWAALFVSSYEYADVATTCLPQSERDWLRLNGYPSMNWRIAIGAVDEARTLRDWVQHRALSLPHEIEWNGHRRMQITSQVFDQLYILSFWSEYPFLLDWSSFARWNGLHPIWPISGDPTGKPFFNQTQESIMHGVDILCDTLNQEFSM